MLTRLLRSLLSSATNQTQSAVGLPKPAPKPRYSADGLSTVHDASFLKDPHFQASYRLGAESGHGFCDAEDLHIEWRVYVCCWAATHACRLPGDFVECGVHTGITSRAVANYVAFERQDRRFWLVDTFAGIPIEQTSGPEQAEKIRDKNARLYFDCYEAVRTYFARYQNVTVVRGRVPEILPEVLADRVSYLHIDMNLAHPEVAALEHFWPRLTVGAVVVFDDYGYGAAHGEQKAALDAFAQSVQTSILALPTGQGLLIKV
jgi:O-methyltransferase